MSLMSKPNGDGVVVTDVLVVRRSGFGWHVEIEGRQMFLATPQIAPGCSMPTEGERGSVTLTAGAADDLMRSVYDGASEVRRRRHS